MIAIKDVKTRGMIFYHLLTYCYAVCLKPSIFINSLILTINYEIKCDMAFFEETLKEIHVKSVRLSSMPNLS